VLGEPVASLARCDWPAGDDPRHVLNAVAERRRVLDASVLAELLAMVGGDRDDRVAQPRVVPLELAEQPCDLLIGVVEAGVVGGGVVRSIAVGEIPRVEARPATALAVEGGLAVRPETGAPIVARHGVHRATLRKRARDVGVHEVEVE
jgi:hypothetical protein